MKLVGQAAIGVRSQILAHRQMRAAAIAERGHFVVGFLEPECAGGAGGRVSDHAAMLRLAVVLGQAEEHPHKEKPRARQG